MLSNGEPPKPPSRKTASISRKNIPGSSTNGKVNTLLEKDNHGSLEKETIISTSSKGILKPTTRRKAEASSEEDIPKPPIRKKVGIASGNEIPQLPVGFRFQNTFDLEKIYELITIRNSPEVPAHRPRLRTENSLSSEIPKPPPRYIALNPPRPPPHPHRTNTLPSPDESDSPPPVPPRIQSDDEIDQEIVFLIQKQIEEYNQNSNIMDEQTAEPYASISEADKYKSINDFLEEFYRFLLEENTTVEESPQDKLQ